MINRKEVRARLAEILQDEVPSAQAVMAYQTTDFEGQSPVILVMSAGSLRPTRRLLQHHVVLVLNVYVAVGEEAMAADEAEDILDNIEYEVMSALEAHDTDPLWTGWDVENPSLVDKVIVRDPYLFESIPIVFTLRG